MCLSQLSNFCLLRLTNYLLRQGKRLWVRIDVGNASAFFANSHDANVAEGLEPLSVLPLRGPFLLEYLGCNQGRRTASSLHKAECAEPRTQPVP